MWNCDWLTVEPDLFWRYLASDSSCLPGLISQDHHPHVKRPTRLLPHYRPQMPKKLSSAGIRSRPPHHREEGHQDEHEGFGDMIWCVRRIFDQDRAPVSDDWAAWSLKFVSESPFGRSRHVALQISPNQKSQDRAAVIRRESISTFSHAYRTHHSIIATLSQADDARMWL